MNILTNLSAPKTLKGVYLKKTIYSFLFCKKKDLISPDGEPSGRGITKVINTFWYLYYEQFIIFYARFFLQAVLIHFMEWPPIFRQRLGLSGLCNGP